MSISLGKTKNLTDGLHVRNFFKYPESAGLLRLGVRFIAVIYFLIGLAGVTLGGKIMFSAGFSFGSALFMLIVMLFFIIPLLIVAAAIRRVTPRTIINVAFLSGFLLLTTGAKFIEPLESHGISESLSLGVLLLVTVVSGRLFTKALVKWLCYAEPEKRHVNPFNKRAKHGSVPAAHPSTEVDPIFRQMSDRIYH